MKTPRQNPPRAEDRKERLKAALKVNIARRKAQAAAKAKTTGQATTGQATTGQTAQTAPTQEAEDS